MLEISFPPNLYERQAPGVKLGGDTIIKIPESGELKPGSHKDFIKNYNQDGRRKIPQVDIKDPEPVIIVSTSNSAGGYDTLMIYWIKERKEWVVIGSYSWMESMVWGNDERYYGPCGLGDFTASLVLAAYEIPKDEISLNKVRHMTPQELGYLSLKTKYYPYIS